MKLPLGIILAGFLLQAVEITGRHWPTPQPVLPDRSDLQSELECCRLELTALWADLATFVPRDAADFRFQKALENRAHKVRQRRDEIQSYLKSTRPPTPNE